jgi:hypothetical protein
MSFEAASVASLLVGFAALQIDRFASPALRGGRLHGVRPRGGQMDGQSLPPGLARFCVA